MPQDGRRIHVSSAKTVRMRASFSFPTAGWRPRDWALTALAFVVVCVVGLTAGRGLAAFGGDVLRLRLGGDAQATRVVVDLDGAVEGSVVEAGRDGRVVVALRGARARSPLEGEGRGLVRRWRVASESGGSRVELTLAAGARIERRFLLPPGDGVEHHRYVVDLAADGRPAAAAAAEPRPSARREKPLIVIDAGHGGRDPGSLGHRSQIRALSGMGSLIPGFTIAPVIDTEDAQVGGFHHSNRRQGGQHSSTVLRHRCIPGLFSQVGPRPIQDRLKPRRPWPLPSHKNDCFPLHRGGQRHVRFLQARQ